MQLNDTGKAILNVIGAVWIAVAALGLLAVTGLILVEAGVWLARQALELFR